MELAWGRPEGPSCPAKHAIAICTRRPRLARMRPTVSSVFCMSQGTSTTAVRPKPPLMAPVTSRRLSCRFTVKTCGERYVFRVSRASRPRTRRVARCGKPVFSVVPSYRLPLNFSPRTTCWHYQPHSSSGTHPQCSLSSLTHTSHRLPSKLGGLQRTKMRFGGRSSKPYGYRRRPRLTPPNTLSHV